MLIKSKPDILPSEITPESVYLSRRKFLVDGTGLALGFAAGGLSTQALGADGDGLRARAPADMVRSAPAPWWEPKFASISPVAQGGPFSTEEALTPYSDVVSYNNFYEFGVEKGDPIANSGQFEADPWSVTIEGEVDKPGIYNLEDILKPHALEERIYRLRCVERWSMVIPWVGFPLADLIKQFQPNSKAKYVQFFTLFDPSQMPGQRSRFSTISWPYREALRIDEAVHPLSFIAVGLYGNYLPPQNGAPLRLVVPWKYGFKSIKSIVKVRFSEVEPETSWNMLAPEEYGFYANVNPEVHHPRWRQDMETRLPQSLLGSTRMKTEMFNGYGEQVASLYSGMDLARFY
jgi:sulfoxide reductase catalytic subunit YedY